MDEKETNNSKTKVTLPLGTKMLYCTPLSCVFQNNVNMNPKYCMEFSKKWKPENMLPNINSSSSKKKVEKEKEKGVEKRGNKQKDKGKERDKISEIEEFSGFVY